MKDIISPGSARRQALRAVNQDGLVDTFLGFAMLMAALYMFLDKFLEIEVTALPAVLPLIVAIGIQGLRKRYTWPRVGYANLKTRRTRIGTMVVVAAALVLLLGLFLLVGVFGVTISDGLKRLLPLPLICGVAVWLTLLALQTGFTRYYIYAGVLGAGLAAAYGLGLQTALTFIVPMAAAGMLMEAVGVACFARFLKQHPRPEEMPDAE